VPYKGAVSTIIDELTQGIAKTMGYIGAATIPDTAECASFVRITGAGRGEERHSLYSWGIMTAMADKWSHTLPVTGVGVMIVNEQGDVLLGKRKNAHGNGEYAFPGGKLDHSETFEDCALRETREECGIEIANIRFHIVTNMRAYYPEHFTHINMMADHKSGAPRVCEPNKCEHWAWYDPHDPPLPLFRATEIVLQQWRGDITGTYFDVAS